MSCHSENIRNTTLKFALSKRNCPDGGRRCLFSSAQACCPKHVHVDSCFLS